MKRHYHQKMWRRGGEKRDEKDGRKKEKRCKDAAMW
jgi:hypothetical protein